MVRRLCTTSLNKSYKMVVLRVLLDQSELFEGADLQTFSMHCRRFMQNHPVLRRDLEGDRHAVDHENADDAEWSAWWIEWPISRWLDKQNGSWWFKCNGDRFLFDHDCPEDLQPVLESLTEELIDWRLAAYSKNHGFVDTDQGEHAFDAKVSHAGGRPILFVHEKSKDPRRPNASEYAEMPHTTTIQDVDQRQLDAYRRMTGEERFAIALGLYEASLGIAREAIRSRLPHADDATVEEKLRERIRFGYESEAQKSPSPNAVKDSRIGKYKHDAQASVPRARLRHTRLRVVLVFLRCFAV